jgi:predicted RNA-binding Zn-ribbon protein involved in translation (DUF1610 family)
MVVARCLCGYENERLLVGGGMLTFMEHCAAPAFCASCADVVVVDLMAPEISCPTCGGVAVAYDDPSLRASGGARRERSSIDWNLPDGRSFALVEGAVYRCPRCQQDTLSFTNVGSFD